MYSRTVKTTQNPTPLSRPSNGVYEFRSPADKSRSELRNGQFNTTSTKLESITKPILNERSRNPSTSQNNPILPAKINHNPINTKQNYEKNTFDSVFNRTSNKSETVACPRSTNIDKYKLNGSENNQLYNKLEAPIEKSIYLNQNQNSNSILKNNYGGSNNFDGTPIINRFDNKNEDQLFKNVKFEGSNGISQNFNKIKGGNEEAPKIPRTLTRDIEEEEKPIDFKPNSSLYKPYSFEKSEIRPAFGSEAKKRSMAGLRNIGNTCFLNSTLQCLFNTPQFSDYFIDGLYKDEINEKNDKGVAKEFASLIKKVRSPAAYGAESTYNLKYALSKFSTKFTGYDQEDAQEFLRTLLESLLSDLNRVKKKPNYKELKDESNKSLNHLSNDWFAYFKSFDDSIVNDFFQGQYLSEIRCQKCLKKSLTFDNFLDLSVSFTRGLKMVMDVDLDRMIEHFFKEEELEPDHYKCANNNCGKTNSTKKICLWRLPKILVIHLKRFNFGRFRREKIDTLVRFPLKDLDLRRYIGESNDKSVTDCTRYDLFGIVNHSGSLYGGHYTSESMNPTDKKWYRYNDDYVSEVPNFQGKDYTTSGSSSPYLLFYAKKNLF